jgi:hypothetical protein
MATLTLNSKMTEGYYGDTWRAGESAVYEKPYIFKEIQDYYSAEKAFMLNYLRLAGGTTTIPSDKITVFYKGALQRLVTVGTAGVATTVAGHDITITLSAADYDSDSGKSYLRTDFIVYVPAQYTSDTTDTISPHGMRVYSQSGTGVATSYVCKPLGLWGIVSTGLPAGTQLIVGDSSYGRGDGQPASLVDHMYNESFYTQISKETMSWDGGILAIQMWADELRNGRNSYLEGTANTHLRLDAQIEYAMWMGSTNLTTDNTYAQVTSANVMSGRSPSKVKGRKVLYLTL